MDLNGGSNPPNTRVQPSIRSFFQPKTPQYSAPPGPTSSKTSETIPPASKNTLPPKLAPPQGPTPPSNPGKTTPPKPSVIPIEQHHIQPLRRINSLLLPISYPDSFYHRILTPPPPLLLSRVITYPEAASDKVIGGIVCRLDPTPTAQSTPENPQDTFDVYIQSLALLSPYQDKGLATQALEDIVQAVVSQHALHIESFYAHVWTENTEALEWYLKRGFAKEGGVMQGYYMKLKPATAWVLRRRLGPTDYLSRGFGNNVEVVPPPSAGEELRARPTNLAHTKSFQDRRPDMEWNDLPEDVLRNDLLKAPSANGSRVPSAASSRSSSRSGAETKAKKKRQYPAAAFGS